MIIFCRLGGWGLSWGFRDVWKIRKGILVEFGFVFLLCWSFRKCFGIEVWVFFFL